MKFFSKNIGVISIFPVLIFTIWSSLGGTWYDYILNFIIISLAVILIGTNFIQGTTRSFSYIYLYGYKGIIKAIIMLIPVSLFLIVAYIILGFVFNLTLQYILFFITYIFLSIAVAMTDNHFRKAIKRTKILQKMNKN